MAVRFISHNDVARPDAITTSGDGTRLRFTVKGQVKGLWPGKRKALKLRITNRNSFAIRVISLSVTASKSDKPRCSERWLKAKETKRLSLVVPAGAGGTASYPVTLGKNAPNACQGARWPLLFRATARRLR